MATIHRQKLSILNGKTRSVTVYPSSAAIVRDIPGVVVKVSSLLENPPKEKEKVKQVIDGRRNTTRLGSTNTPSTTSRRAPVRRHFVLRVMGSKR